MLLAFLWASFSVAGANEASFIGAARCRLCHRAAYESWKLTPHARAGLSVTDADPSCLSCHATSGRDVPDVQCEACHGAGGDYWPGEVMIDPDKARMAGLVRPDEALCRRCHTGNEPGHERAFVMPARADFALTVHAVPVP